jgi:glycosyl transferase family 25
MTKISCAGCRECRLAFWRKVGFRAQFWSSVATRLDQIFNKAGAGHAGAAGARRIGKAGGAAPSAETDGGDPGQGPVPGVRAPLTDAQAGCLSPTIGRGARAAGAADRRALRKHAMSAAPIDMPRRVSDERSSWPIFVISLPAARARRASCRAEMDRLGLEFEFFDAIVGSDLSQEEIARAYDPDKNARLFKRPLSAAEIGCYLSHRALWDRVGRSRAAGAIILEDDFDADDALPALLDEICGMDLSNCLVKLHSQRKAKGARLATLTGGYRLLAPAKIPGMTLGYVVERRAAAALAEKSLPFGRPVDMDLKHWWDFGVPVLLVEPAPLRVRTADGVGAIESSREAAKPAGLLGGWVRLVRNLRYQWLYLRQRLRARSKIRPIVSRFANPTAPNEAR